MAAEFFRLHKKDVGAFFGICLVVVRLIKAGFGLGFRRSRRLVR